MLARAMPSMPGFPLASSLRNISRKHDRGRKGALLYHACIPVSEFGSWPDGVPVQIHAMDADPYFVNEDDLQSARELVESVDDAELFLYPGAAHLFADNSLASYDAAAAGLLLERTLAFLAADRLG